MKNSLLKQAFTKTGRKIKALSENKILLHEVLQELADELRRIKRENKKHQFEPWIDQKNMGGKFRIKPDSQARYRPTSTGLSGILTNPVYIGWWIPRNGSAVKNNQEAIIDEGFFVYAHKRVSRFTLEGERQKPAKDE